MIISHSRSEAINARIIVSDQPIKTWVSRFRRCRRLPAVGFDALCYCYRSFHSYLVLRGWRNEVPVLEAIRLEWTVERVGSEDAKSVARGCNLNVNAADIGTDSERKSGFLIRCSTSCNALSLGALRQRLRHSKHGSFDSDGWGQRSIKTFGFF